MTAAPECGKRPPVGDRCRALELSSFGGISIDVEVAVDDRCPGAIAHERNARIDLRVAEILTAERVPKTDRLLKLGIRIDEEERTVVAGLAARYEADQLVGRKIIVVANLRPAKLRGIESQGMLLAAEVV